MLQNAYLLAKFGADTAENERNVRRAPRARGDFGRERSAVEGRARVLREMQRRIERSAFQAEQKQGCAEVSCT